MMRAADTLLTVGSNFPYTQFMPPLDQARAVQIDIDPVMIGMRYPYEVNLVGDAASTLRALLPLLVRKPAGGHRSRRGRLVGHHGDAGRCRRGPDQPDAPVRRAESAAAR